MDDDTRFWITQELAYSKHQHNADNLLQQTLRQTGGSKPTNFITDGLPAYDKSSKKVKIWYKNSTHQTYSFIR